ncbi:MAG: transketolase, partial [Acidimicrobiia bacterium]
MGTVSLRDRFAEVTSELLDDLPELAVVLADIGVGRLAENGASARHPDRVINVGIREQLMIGVAGGLALS